MDSNLGTIHEAYQNGAIYRANPVQGAAAIYGQI
jgi:hypothetical protein